MEKRPQDPLIQKNHLLCLYESGQHQAFLQQLVHTQYHDAFSLIERGFNLYLRFYHFSKAKKMITDNLLLLEKIHYKHFLYSKYYLYKRQLKKSYFHLIEAHKEGLSLDPYLDLLAKIYKYTKRIDKSFETLTRHYAYSHSNESLFDQAILLLSTGKSIAKAWSLYQSRHRLDRFMRKQAEKHLTYTYTPLIRKDKNTRIALVPEQGLGDAIFSLRFLTTCSSHTSKITLFERKELYPLLKSHAHLWKIDIKCFTNFSEIAREQFDYHASLLDLPYLLQINSQMQIFMFE